MIRYAVFETEELWLNFRAPYFTSSESSALMPEPKNKAEILSVGAKTYVRKCAASVLAPPPLPQYNHAMEHGKTTEPFAVLELAKHLGKSIEDDDFIYTSNNGFVFFYDDEYNLGGTPDVIMKALKKSAEIKCPNSDTHLEHLTFLTPEDVKIHLPKYYGQMQSNMYLTKTDECIFMSYDNRFYNDKLHEHYIHVPKDDEYIERLLIKAKAGKDYKELILKTINEKMKVYDKEDHQNFASWYLAKLHKVLTKSEMKSTRKNFTYDMDYYMELPNPSKNIKVYKP